jgi:hypothetical protein
MSSFYYIIKKIAHILKGNCVSEKLGYFLKHGGTKQYEYFRTSPPHKIEAWNQ